MSDFLNAKKTVNTIFHFKDARIDSLSNRLALIFKISDIDKNVHKERSIH